MPRRRAKHRRTLFDSYDDSEEGGDPRAPRNPHLLAGEQAAELRADGKPCRDVEESDDSRFPWKSASSGLWGGTGAQTQRAAIYTFARAGVVIGRARLAAVPSPSHLHAHLLARPPPPPCVCLCVCFCAVCALRDVSPRDRWLCVLPGWQMNVNACERERERRFGRNLRNSFMRT